MPEGGAARFFFDTVTLSNFALAGRLDLLIGRYGQRAQLTPEVMDEVSDGIASGHSELRDIENAVAVGNLSSAQPLSAAERMTYRSLLRSLSSGEASCIVCAKERGGTVVTDDRAARACCAEFGVAFTGTIGILKACCRRGTLDPHTADIVLRAMIEGGYHSPVSRVSDLL
jgi:predicted nucleic acid-binding protein